jgi:hypothetical protein
LRKAIGGFDRKQGGRMSDSEASIRSKQYQPGSLRFPMETSRSVSEFLPRFAPASLDYTTSPRSDSPDTGKVSHSQTNPTEANPTRLMPDLSTHQPRQPVPGSPSVRMELPEPRTQTQAQTHAQPHWRRVHSLQRRHQPRNRRDLRNTNNRLGLPPLLVRLLFAVLIGPLRGARDGVGVGARGGGGGLGFGLGKS